MYGPCFPAYALFEHGAGDDHLLDLRGTLIDGGDADIPVEPLDLILAGVAVAAVELKTG